MPKKSVIKVPHWLVESIRNDLMDGLHIRDNQILKVIKNKDEKVIKDIIDEASYLIVAYINTNGGLKTEPKKPKVSKKDFDFSLAQ
jgi:hypothetical protein